MTLKNMSLIYIFLVIVSFKLNITIYIPGNICYVPSKNMLCCSAMK